MKYVKSMKFYSVYAKYSVPYIGFIPNFFIKFFIILSVLFDEKIFIIYFSYNFFPL